MDSSVCIFCDSEYGDPLLPYHIDKVSALCHLTFNREMLVNKKMCMRCKINMDLIENAYRLRDVMVLTLNAKLTAGTQMSNHNAATGAGETENGTRVHLDNNYVPFNTAEQEGLGGHSLTPRPSGPTPPHPTIHPPTHPPTLSAAPSVKEETVDNPQPRINGGRGFGFPAHANGMYNGHSTTPPNPRINGRRIPNCHKCHISLKTRPYYDAIKHINRCNGQGIRPGRPSTTPKPDVFPCLVCGRRLATREAHEIHIAKCDGTSHHSRGRKPADNTCMLCNEDLVYRHILKKHLRQKHGINAQRLDDSVLAALKTGSGTGCNVKEQVLSRIQQKMLKDMYDSDRPEGEVEVGDNQINNEDSSSQDVIDSSSQHLIDSPANAYEDEAVENKVPPTDLAPEKRNRRKVKPSKYVPEVFTCELCTKQFEYQSQYTQHCCFQIQNGEGESEHLNANVDEEDINPGGYADMTVTDSPEPLDGNLIETYTAMEVENGVAND